MKYIIDVPDEQRHIYDEEDKVLSFLVINKNSKCNMAIDIEAIPYDDSEPEVMKNNYIHLCSSCQYGSSLVPCPGEVKDNIFCGGNSNICCCSEYKPDTADRKAIEDEVWKFADKYYNMNDMDFDECYDSDVMPSYSEAKARYDDWKKSKDEIRVGDEVLDHLGKPYIIYKINDVSAYGVGFDECPLSHNCFPVCYNKKTGRHFDEVEELLNKISEESE